MTWKQKTKLSDLAVIATVVLVVGGGIMGLTRLFMDTVGPECLVIHCVKLIR